MKVLVDTCVWSLLLRRRTPTPSTDEQQQALASLRQAIQQGNVTIIGPIRQEVLSGVREPAQFNRLRTALQAFADEPVTTIHYEEAARFLNICRSHGVECGMIDILICSVAAQAGWSILTYDHGIKRCIEVLRLEGLMH